MYLGEKLKETGLAVLPISAMVLALGWGVADFSASLAGWFVVGSVLVVAGLALFLMGVDLGVSRVGERCGAALTERKSLAVMLGVAFAIGLVVTVAEPDIQVFGDQVHVAFAGAEKRLVVGSIASGVALFLTLGVFRMVSRIPLKWALGFGYALVLGLLALAPRAFVGVAFDSGGATTGPMTVPFIMALGIGVAAVRGGRGGGFGLTGIASVGPVAAMLAMAVLAPSVASPGSGGADAETALVGLGGGALGEVAHEVMASALPLYALSAVLQAFLLKMTRRQFLRATVGFALAALGLFVFLAGVRCGFMEAGREVGLALGARMADGWGWRAATLAVALFTGAVVVCAEPAVWVLGEQVEQASGGMVRRRALLAFLAAATGVAVSLAVVRASEGFALPWLLVPGYLLALGLMRFSPETFTGMAFDSGGVASGPLTTAFVLPLTLGVAEGCGRHDDAFGVIALVAMMPLVAIQAMGIAMEAKRRRADAGQTIGGTPS